MTGKVYWRCFHCGDVFTKAQERWAREHFGRDQGELPVCLIREPGEAALLTALRKAQDELARFYDEDQDLMRAMCAMSADHTSALRREEERGYAKGVADTREWLRLHPGVNSRAVTGTITMSKRLLLGDTAVARVAFKDKGGEAVTLPEGSVPVWSLDQTALATVEPASDGMSALISALAVGLATISVTAEGDPSAGVDTITASASINIVDEAATGEITFDGDSDPTVALTAGPKSTPADGDTGPILGATPNAAADGATIIDDARRDAIADPNNPATVDNTDIGIKTMDPASVIAEDPEAPPNNQAGAEEEA